MITYKLPGMSISVNGTHPRIRFALEAMFQMCPITEEKADIHIEGCGHYDNKIDALLPDWLVEEINNGHNGSDVLMTYGPEGNIAVVSTYEDLLFCAWSSMNGDNQIQFIGGIKENGRTIGPIYSVLTPILREYFLVRGYLLLHGAAVICPNDIGILLIAPSGGGKTTTALSLVRNGARLLGDDMVVLQTSTDKVTAYGIQKGLNLREKTINFFEELQGIPGLACTHTDLQDKLIPPQKVYGPDCMTVRAGMNVVYFVNIAEEGPSVRPLSTHEALNKLILSHSFTRNQKVNATSILKLCESLSRVRAYDINTGPDPKCLGDWLMHNCSNHAMGLI